MKNIILPTAHGTIGIMLTSPGPDGRRDGTISSMLKMDDAEHPAIDAIESLILAHACVGVDVESPAYIEGIEAALDAIINNID